MAANKSVKKKAREVKSPGTTSNSNVRALAELVGLASRLNSSRSFDNLLSNFYRGLSEIWPGAGVRMCSIDIESDLLIPLESMSAEPIPINGSLLGTVAIKCSNILVRDLETHPDYLRGKEAPPGLTWKSAIAFPVRVNDTPSYVIGVFLPSGTNLTTSDAVILERAVSLIEPLLSRWQRHDMELTAFRAIARGIASAIDARDPHLIGHGERVSEFSQAIARMHGLDGGFTQRLGLAGLLHDVGRLGIPEAILTKPGKLTPEEYRIVTAHPELSVRFLQKVEYLYDVFGAIRHHHEHFDGSGYPDETEGDDIPLGARIITVADSFDAMTSPRSFRGAMSDEDAIEELENGKGTQFDPLLVEDFIRAYDEKMIISQNVLKADDPLDFLRAF